MLKYMIFLLSATTLLGESAIWQFNNDIKQPLKELNSEINNVKLRKIENTKVDTMINLGGENKNVEYTNYGDVSTGTGYPVRGSANVFVMKNYGSMSAATATIEADVKYAKIINNGTIGSDSTEGMGNEYPLRIRDSHIQYIENNGIIQTNNKPNNRTDTISDFFIDYLIIDNKGKILNYGDTFEVLSPPWRKAKNKHKASLYIGAKYLYVINRKNGIITSEKGMGAVVSIDPYLADNGARDTAKNMKYGDPYKDNGIKLNFKDGIFINEGLLQGKLKSIKLNISGQSKDSNFLFRNTGKMVGDATLTIKENENLLFDNQNGSIDGSVDMQINRNSLATLDTRNSVINGNINITANDTKKSQVNMIIDNDTKISGDVLATGNTTLTVEKGTNNLSKYIGFEHLELNGVAKSDDDLTYKKSTEITSQGKFTALGGTLTSQNVVNNGDLIIDNNYKIDGNLENTKNIIFSKDNKFGTLNISKNYNGDVGSVTFNLSNAGNNLMTVENIANGKTQIFLNNTVTKKFKKDKNGNRARLLIKTDETKGQAFILMDKKHGIYRYELSDLDTKDKDHFVVLPDNGSHKPKDNSKIEKPKDKSKNVDGNIDIHQLVSEKIGSYLDGIRASQNIFTLRLYRRESLNGNDIRDFWIIYDKIREHHKISKRSLITDSYGDMVRLGYDLVNKKLDKHFTKVSKGRFKFGVMTSFGAIVERSHQNPKNLIRLNESANKIAHSTLDAYSFGVYSTFYHKNKKFFIDTWALYGRTKNSIDLDGNNFNSRASGYEVSIETGYKLRLCNGLTFEPLFQAIYQGINTKDIVEPDGTSLYVLGNNNRQIRYGMRITYYNNVASPFVEYNKIWNSKVAEIRTKNDSYQILGDKMFNELKVGFDNVKISDSMYLWGHYKKIIGKYDYRNGQITFGFKYIL